MAKNKKRIVFPFKIQHFRAMELYFEEMAAKGWMLKKINYMRALFEKCEPAQLKFNAVFYTKQNERDKKKAVMNQAEESGWHLVTSVNMLSVYYSDAQHSAPSLQTTKESEAMISAVALIEKIVVLSVCLTLFALTIVMYLSQLRIGWEVLLSNTIVSGIMLPLFIIILIIEAGFDLSSLRDAKNKIKNSLPVPIYKLEKNASQYIGLSIFMLLILVIMIVFIFDLININYSDSLSLIPSLFFLLFILAAILSPKIKMKSIKKNSADGLIMGLVVIILTSGLLIYFSKIANRDLPKIVVPPQNAMVLQASDFGIKDEIKSSSFTQCASVFVPRYFEYREYTTNYLYNLETEYIKAGNTSLAKYIFNQKYNEVFQTWGDHLIELSPETWGADKVYGTEPYKNNVTYLLLLRRNVVAEVHGPDSIDLSSPTSVAVITEKLRLKE